MSMVKPKECPKCGSKTFQISVKTRKPRTRRTRIVINTYCSADLCGWETTELLAEKEKVNNDH